MFEHLAAKAARNASRKLVWSSLGSFSDLGSEMAPGGIVWPALANRSSKLIWSSLGPFSGLVGSKIVFLAPIRAQGLQKLYKIC